MDVLGTSFTAHIRRLVYVGGTLILLLFLLAFSVYDRAIDEWYWLRFAAPDLQSDLGFSTGMVKTGNYDGRDIRFFGVTNIEPRGAFDRAGFRVGDIPSEWFMHGGAPAGFYARLEHGRGLAPVEFKVVAASDFSTSGRNHERTLIIQVPPRRK